MITGESRAKVENSLRGCTFESESYDATLPGGQLITVWDTAGLNESSHGKVKPQEAIGQLYKLTRRLSSIHLLVFCVQGRIIDTTVKNYKMFNTLCDGSVPIVIVITGLELDPDIGRWWGKNSNALEEEGIQVVGHACVGTVNIVGREEDYKKWTGAVRNLICDNQLALENPWTKEKDGWFVSMVVRFLEIFFGNQSKAMQEELVSSGFTKEEAKKAVKQCMG